VVDADGRFVYMRGPQLANNSPLNQYTLMPVRMRGFFGDREMTTVRALPGWLWC
jgi:hypothetical protein